MISFEQAKRIATAYLDAMNFKDGLLVILESETIEKAYAWIFFYNTKTFIETGDILHALGGNSPIFVSKKDGKISTYSTAYPIERGIEIHEEENKYWSLKLTENVYAEIPRLKYLKDILNLSQKVISVMKSQKQLIIDNGSHVRLERIQQKLREKNIETVLIYNSQL